MVTPLSDMPGGSYYGNSISVDDDVFQVILKCVKWKNK